MVAIVVLVVVVALGGLFLVGLYNGLVRARNAVANAWAQIDVQLKRRYDLIPNLVETAKGYVKHERETLEAVIRARNTASQAREGGRVAETAVAEGQLASVLTRFFALAEAYPDLKANQNFLALQGELSATENKIAFSRQAYNDTVMDYNNRTQVFPANLIAGNFGFRPAEFFKVEDQAQREAPKVSFT